MGQRVYLDTNVLIPRLWETNPDKRARSNEVIRSLRGDVRSYDHFEVFIPKLVLGEAVDKYYDAYADGTISAGRVPPHDAVMENLIDIAETLDAEFCSMKTDTWRVAKALSADDRELCHNDLYIASCAVLDDDSTCLITFDTDLLQTRSIEKIADRRDSRNHSLTVTQTY